MTDLTTWQMEGWNARVEERPVAVNPYDVGTAAHLAWTQGWISAEAGFRRRAGTLGATPEEWAAAAEQMAVELRPDPCAEVEANLAEMERDRQLAELRDRMNQTGGRTFTPEELERAMDLIRHLTRTSAEVMDDMTRSLHAMAEAAMKTFAQIVEDLAPLFQAFQAGHKAQRDRRAAGASSDVHRAILGLPAAPRARLCPAHGEELRGGLCRRCARRADRATTRRR